MRYILILTTFVITNVFAQPQISWQKYFGLPQINSSWADAIVQLNDSGYLLQVRLNNGFGIKKIVRADKNGDTLFSRSYNVYANNIIETYGGGFLLSGGLNAIATIIKLNNNYDTLWSRTFPTMAACTVTQCRDSGYVLAGANRIIKTDPLGNVVWQHNTSGGFASVMECNNGDIIAVGAKSYCKYWATLLDSTGTLKWERQYSDFTINGGYSFYLRGVVQLPDSNFMVVANNDKNPFYASCGGFDVAKINKDNGDTIWTKQYATLTTHTRGASISKIKDKSIFISIDNMLAKIDTAGNMQWSLPIYAVTIYSVAACSDGGVAFAGQYTIGGPQNQYLATYAKTDSLGNIYNFQSIPELAINELRVYPNPAVNQLYIPNGNLLTGQGVTLTVYDALGKVHLQQTQMVQGDFKVDISNLPSGIYMLQLKQEDRLFTGRFVKE